VKQCAEQCAGKEEVLLLEDAAEINLERRQERIKDKKELFVPFVRRLVYPKPIHAAPSHANREPGLMQINSNVTIPSS
jgi:hypothetical protein